MTTDRLLLCEGTACNPSIYDVDQAVAYEVTQTRRWRDQEASASPESVGSEPLWKRQRALIYTTHNKAGLRWVCRICGQERRYGDC